MSDSGDDADPVDRAREEVLEAFARSAEVYGLNRSYGRLYGILYFAGEPLSLDRLVAESGYAKSTVSTAMQRMREFHLVHRRSVPGEGKKAFYEAETDFWRVFEAFLEREVQREIDTMTRALDAAAERLEGVEGERAAETRERIRSLQRTYAQSQRVVSVLTSGTTDRLRDLVDRLTGGE